MAIKKLASGAYQIDFRDARGDRHRASFETRKAADKALTEARSQLHRGEFLAPKTVPTFGAAAEAWLRDKSDRRPATIENWRRQLDRHLLPVLGSQRLDRIDVATVERLRADFRAKLGTRSVGGLMNTMSGVFKAAIRHKYVHHNPVAAAERPYTPTAELTEHESSESGEGTQKVQPDVLNPSEIRRLLDTARSGYYRTLFMLAAATGMRSGELFSLRWSEIEFDDGKGRGIVFVRRSLSWCKGNGDSAVRARFYPPKTKAGIRDIPIPREVVTALKTWKLACPVSEYDLVFPARDGRPMRRSNALRLGLWPALRKAGLRHVTMHSPASQLRLGIDRTRRSDHRSAAAPWSL